MSPFSEMELIMNTVLYDLILHKEHHKFRKHHEVLEHLAEEFAALKLSPKERMARRFSLLCSLEEPVLLPGEQICFLRTVPRIPDCFTPQEWEEIKQTCFIHELGYLSNVTADYGMVLNTGLLALREKADRYGQSAIDGILHLTDRYRDAAVAAGREDLAAVLERVPRYPATNFREALQFFRIIHFALWLEGNYHNTVGRFDQYMLPYFRADMEAGVYTRESALELIEDFFLSFNKDSDLYIGVQQGDNGQSMVLGGINENEEDGFSLLSELCLEASRNLLLIDPKINLRVSSKTPLRVYELGSRLTKAGLGFPQYSNDDVVIPALIKLGYAPEDARNYVVAACWEFIIPGKGADVANIGALSFPKVIDTCLHRDLPNCATMDAFLEAVGAEIRKECDRICHSISNLWFVPSPFAHLVMTEGIYEGARYNNFGIHGTGIATAADSLAAIQTFVYGNSENFVSSLKASSQLLSPETLIQAVDQDFEGYPDLLSLLRYQAPKMGTGSKMADTLSVRLLDLFADALEGKTNCRGGIYRAGTGSAMYYLWHAAEIGASPDGRRKGEPFGTNFSPSLFARIQGPLSVMQSFTVQHFDRAINGGPLTLEFAASMFTEEDSIRKIAQFVKAYIAMGGHQLQLNAVNTQKLLDAQAHPENHRQLVVRIWGWSAYFVELDREYQDHVLKRQQYQI